MAGHWTNGHHSYFQPSNGKAQAMQQASLLYDCACERNWVSQLWSMLAGRSQSLLDLATVRANSTIQGQRYEGIKRVPICQIRGSAERGRSQDFDANFRPLKTHSKARWLGVATARQMGRKLSPVSLIQVGDIYFIEDGHHRISVARARGEQEIEAKVKVWQIAPPPAEQTTSTVSLS